MKAKTNTKTSIILLLATVLIVTAACGSQSEAVTGEKEFLLEVTDNNGNVTSKTIKTDEATVGAALLAEGIIEGEQFDFGLMVSHVNGLRADFTEDGAYWAFHIDGEFAMEGVDVTKIEEGVTYAFVYTPA